MDLLGYAVVIGWGRMEMELDGLGRHRVEQASSLLNPASLPDFARAGIALKFVKFRAR